MKKVLSTKNLKYSNRLYSQPSQHKDHILYKNRKGELKYLSDYEILKSSSYPAEFPSTYVPVEEPEIQSHKGRRALDWLYKKFKEQWNLHRTFVYFDKRDARKQVALGVFIAPSATIIGNVWIRDLSSVWYGAVLRGDLNKIEIGVGVNIQDGAVITTDNKTVIGGFDAEVSIDDYTVIGHGARLHACRVGEECIIGMNSTILEGAVVEDGAIVGAGSLVPAGFRVPAKEVWAGNPIRFIRKVGYIEMSYRMYFAQKYMDLADRHSEEFTKVGRLYIEADKIVKRIEDNIPFETQQEKEHWGVWRDMGKDKDGPYLENNKDREEVIDELMAEEKLKLNK